MKTFLKFIVEVKAPFSYDTMNPRSRSYVPVRNDRGIGDTVADNTITDEEDGNADKKNKLLQLLSKGMKKLNSNAKRRKGAREIRKTYKTFKKK